jgi:hypothetical protein
MIDRPLRVRTAEGASATWRIEHSLEEPWRLSLVTPRGRRYEATGQDMFDCLKQIRRQTDQAKIRLCCNGARKNARPSGFSGSHGAFVLYKIHRWRAYLPGDLVDIFDYAPPRKVATVEEQETYWLAVDRYRKSIFVMMNPVQWITYGYGRLFDWFRDAQMRRRVAKVDRA